MLRGAAAWVAAVQKRSKRVKTKTRTCNANTREAIAITVVPAKRGGSQDPGHGEAITAGKKIR